MASQRLLNFAAIGFLASVVLIVFWQIETDMKEQGIASGGPYDNAASFPRTIAILVAVLLVAQLITDFLKKRTDTRAEEDLRASDLWRGGLMLVVFAVYLTILTTAGYHLATAPMIFAIMWICGSRRYLVLAVSSVAIATAFAFFFEVFLNVVLPLGVWNIFIPW